ncbi:hypothetical protein [Acinetobacter sp. 1000160]|uniref:hypothetical protein n=1 Tax=Acinetobacter sp. 1000160 TaxID=1310800 RepID=UPI00044CA32C|nr:hypothetical protein [Acinetobacter sp. 1000160]EXB49437.1 hypothetical protein J522_1016 [Acinetobacter baumannii 146457]EYT21441.1 hypothetical protein J699_01387 [Acinetobacter sp. 1000160]
MIDKKLDPVGHLKDFSEKDFYWLYVWLCQKQELPVMQLTHREYKDFCFTAILDEKITINEILNKKRTEVIPNQSIMWIGKKDKRLLFWLNFRLKKDYIRLNSINYSDDLYLNFTSKIDIHNEDFKKIENKITEITTIQKQHYLIELKNEWVLRLNLTYDFEKWLSKSDKNQLAWCLEYLNEHPRFKDLGIRMSYNSNKKLTIIYILHIFDVTPFNNKEDYENIIDRLKRSWNQYKFNQSEKSKDEYKIRITKKTNNLLLELCQQSNLSKEKMIEKIILDHHKALNTTQPIRNRGLIESSNIINFKDQTSRNSNLEND